MESLTPGYENSSAESVVSFYTPSVNDDVAFINRLLLLFIQTVDIDELLTIYHSHLRHILPLSSLSLGGEDLCISRGITSADNTRVITLHVNASEQSLTPSGRVVRYWFTRALTMNEKGLLSTLHNAFSHQVNHALSFSKLSQLATKDALTGLSNRRAFDEDIEAVMLACQRKNEQFGLLVIDLDNFKQVNDACGHEEGDNVLVAFANVLTQSLRANEKAYRFGGDEFCCILDASVENTIGIVAQRIVENAANTHLLKRHNITVSVGGTLSKTDEAMITTFKRADRALYDVKQQGKHGYLLS